MVADFSGYATKNGLVCSDGRTIMPDAFKEHDGFTVPLVWQHMHDSSENVLGHAILENRPDGVYTYGFFNGTPAGQNAKELVRHGDVVALSIFANKLIQQGKNVLHGAIREVSLVLSGANPGALIDNVNLAHSDGGYETIEDEAVIYTGLTLEHADVPTPGDATDPTVQDIIDTLNEEQKTAVYFLVGEAINAASADNGGTVTHSAEDEEVVDAPAVDAPAVDAPAVDAPAVDAPAVDAPVGTDVPVVVDVPVDGTNIVEADASTAVNNESTEVNTLVVSDDIQHQEGTEMTRNVFQSNDEAATPMRETLTHAQIDTILTDARKSGSLKEAFLAHAGEYGITNISLLFPDAQAVSSMPDLIARQAAWVPAVLDATKHAPFAKIKSLSADLTAAEARAKGYVKGAEKTDEVIQMLRRTTGPTTVYKKQKLDRDDVLDITDFDVIAWLKWEIRFMLNEEIARAILIGDGRSAISPDKIKDPAGTVDGIGIRSIANDAPLYAITVMLAANVSADVMVDEITRSRTAYRGSGSPSLYTTDTVLTDLLLLKDKMGRRLYDTEAALASALRVSSIVSVAVLEEIPDILGIIVNLVDYTIGANKGGELSFFEDFDIDFNQQKYLLETRISGALTKPKSAIVIRRQVGTLATAAAPSFDGPTNTITVPTVAGVVYTINDVVAAAGPVVITVTTEVVAVPDTGYYLAANTTNRWTFTHTV
jgi:hypothetical protein